MKNLNGEVERRRTFAIISHPDAGKTTLTEKLLVLGGAIQLAGVVKARGEQRRTRSDWMKVERERGISVTASVMTFDHRGTVLNLLDTPGHEDFSEDTYRTLSAVDSAIMVLDAAKGIESQTRKLFEVCRLRNIPILTFINKLDREGRDPFELLDEVESDLALEVSPVNWPIGAGQGFRGIYALDGSHVSLFDRGANGDKGTTVDIDGLDDGRLAELLGASDVERLREGAELAAALCQPLDVSRYRQGELTPVFFGTALHNLGVRDLLAALVEMAPHPQPQPALSRTVDPRESEATGFVFKIQANMDPKHRDRIAFVRLCSGYFQRGMRMRHCRTGRSLNVHNPLLFLAQSRERAEEAWAGDIIGIPNYGNLRIGDSLSLGEDLSFTGIPSFAPEFLRKVRPVDPMRAKHLGRALQQLAEEGAAQVFKTHLGSDWILGVAGALQFEVLADRIRTEYDIVVEFESTSLHTALWIEADDHQLIKEFSRANSTWLAHDHGGAPVFLAANAWRLNRATEDWPRVRFLRTREQCR